MGAGQQRCAVCGQLDVFPELRCTHCGFLRASLALFPRVEADLPAAYRGRPAPPPPPSPGPRAPAAPGPAGALGASGAPAAPDPAGAASGAPAAQGGAGRGGAASDRRAAEQELLNAALARVATLAARVRASERLSADDRADLYESLLLSLLKIERQGLREGALALERAALRRGHRRALALVGVGGGLLGALCCLAAFYLASRAAS
ncbi:MAG: hypothetical protein FJ138_03970 [Deltaproteobacteria bacterium]|nr:hypothetical protein [Deltaproteobacteria bacterium]